jgi:hypothetical protein
MHLWLSIKEHRCNYKKAIKHIDPDKFSFPLLQSKDSNPYRVPSDIAPLYFVYDNDGDGNCPQPTPLPDKGLL